MSSSGGRGPPNYELEVLMNAAGRNWNGKGACAALLLSCAVVAGCAAGDTRFTVTEPAGFWMGLWHGLIACIAFVVGLFSDGVEVYERSNNGAWYDLGFLIGVGMFSGSGHKSHSSWRTRRRKTAGFEIPAGKGSAKVSVDFSWTGDKDGAGADNTESGTSDAGATTGDNDPAPLRKESE